MPVSQDIFHSLHEALVIEPSYVALVLVLFFLLCVFVLFTAPKTTTERPVRLGYYFPPKRTNTKMCAVALPMPPTPRATAVESPKRIPMPGHWEEEPGAILREKPVEDEHEPNEPDKDPDLFRYPPPAALSELANVSSETIALVVRSSVEHVFQQVEAERQRTQETAATSDATSEETPASLDEDEEAVASRDIGLMPELHITRETTTNSQSTSSQGSVDEQSSRNQRRHRFGIRRIFQHIVEKGESSSNNSFSIGSLPAHIHHIPPPAPSPGTSAPSSFTQLIHKHIKSSSAIESGSSTEIV